MTDPARRAVPSPLSAFLAEGRITGRAAASSRGARRSAAAAALAAAALLGACASPQDVQETRDLAKAYETRVFDLERQLAECERDRGQMRAQLQNERLGNLSTASYSGDIQERMRSLESLLDGLGRPPGPIERFEVEGGYLFMIQDKVLFESGSDELGQEGQAALRSLSEEIALAPHGRIFVRGHTDSDPVKRPETVRRFPHGNIDLAASRAVSVGAFLIEEKLIDASDIVIMGFGQHQPLRPNDSADNKRLNRRVELFVSDPDSDEGK